MQITFNYVIYTFTPKATCLSFIKHLKKNHLKDDKFRISLQISMIYSGLQYSTL